MAGDDLRQIERKGLQVQIRPIQRFLSGIPLPCAHIRHPQMMAGKPGVIPDPELIGISNRFESPFDRRPGFVSFAVIFAFAAVNVQVQGIVVSAAPFKRFVQILSGLGRSFLDQNIGEAA
ncbi:hypothetical protein D3C81_345160 [compost metagenome]